MDFQLRPTDEKQLWFAFNLLDWPGEDKGQIRDLDRFLKVQFEEVHLGSSSVKERLAVMDENGIHAQIVYPNILGFGGQNACLVMAREPN